MKKILKYSSLALAGVLAAGLIVETVIFSVAVNELSRLMDKRI